MITQKQIDQLETEDGIGWITALRTEALRDLTNRGALQLGLFDQLAGAAFGLVKALVFIKIFLIVFITYPKWGLDKTIEESVFGSVTVEMVDRAPVIVRMLPDVFENKVSDFVARL